MCGIAGWYRRGRGQVPADIVAAQCNAILHRGPDDWGIEADGDFGFGMRRLSILDITGGHQPMATPDGRFAIVFNGEIYNHLDLRKALIADGYRFVSHCDTETVLAAFAHWGNNAWAQLEGMFTAAIWDRKKRELTLARDPLGIKPLFLTEQHGGIAFASELKALRVLPGHAFDVDERAVHDFFSYGNIRKPRSIFAQVTTLDPGHFLTIGADGGKRVRAYWQARFRTGERLQTGEWIEQMQSMLLKTTARHMQSDVPVGIFLSGGIDSGALAAAMRRSTNQPIMAFTIGYPGARMDETQAAREVAHRFSCEHVVVPLDVNEAAENLPRIHRCFDEPFAGRAAVPTWYVSKAAAEHVKVVLDGAGGDELFAGYKRNRNARTVERLRPLTGALGPLCKLVDRLPAASSPRLNYLRQHALRLAEYIDLSDGFQQFFAGTELTTSQLRRDLYEDEFWQRHEGDGAYARLEKEYFPDGCGSQASALEQFLFADLTLNMPARSLTRLDRASMAHSLEARVPFLSHKMVDWALTVPTDLKLHGNTGKFILRKAIAPWMPHSVLNRPKQGFQVPLKEWMRGRLGTLAREIWYDSGAAAAGFLRSESVERLFAEHRQHRADHGRILYAIAVFGFWWAENLAACDTQSAGFTAHRAKLVSA